MCPPENALLRFFTLLPRHLGQNPLANCASCEVSSQKVVYIPPLLLVETPRLGALQYTVHKTAISSWEGQQIPRYIRRNMRENSKGPLYHDLVLRLSSRYLAEEPVRKYRTSQ